MADDTKDDKKDDKPDLTAELESFKAANAALEARLAKLENPEPKNDDDLSDKARKDREQKELKAKESNELESALKFNIGSKDWLKANQSLLPKDIDGIFASAEKETYGSAIEKASDIKANVIQQFFKVQTNVDLLTPSLKSALDDFLKLTKNGKQERAQAIYDSVFEPAFEMLKRIKKAEQLNQNGLKGENDSETAYKERLLAGSKKHYLGEKNT